MADLSISVGLMATIDGITITLSADKTEVLTAPEKAFTEIVTTSTTITDIGTGSSMTWDSDTNPVAWLGLKNLSETPGESIRIVKGTVDMVRLYPGQSCSFPVVCDATPTPYRWDADAGTPRLLVVAFGDTDAA